LGPFTPKSYDSATGLLTLSDDLTTENVFNNAILVDTASNVGYKILEVIDSTSFKLDIDLNANFTNAYIAPMESFFVTSIESVFHKQVYSIKCFAQGEPIFAHYLSTLVQFVLLRYKELLFEGRGFERSSFTMGPLYLANDLTGVENTFGQDITITGFVRLVWPKVISPALQGIKIVGVNALTGSVPPLSIQAETETQGWGTV
jgi:hypothetical protein